jgi:hypothetical protein
LEALEQKVKDEAKVAVEKIEQKETAEEMVIKMTNFYKNHSEQINNEFMFIALSPIFGAAWAKFIISYEIHKTAEFLKVFEILNKLTKDFTERVDLFPAFKYSIPEEIRIVSYSRVLKTSITGKYRTLNSFSYYTPHNKDKEVIINMAKQGVLLIYNDLCGFEMLPHRKDMYNFYMVILRKLFISNEQTSRTILLFLNNSDVKLEPSYKNVLIQTVTSINENTGELEVDNSNKKESIKVILNAFITEYYGNDSELKFKLD